MPAQAVQRVGQEGSRWVNMRPSGDEVAAWFKGNVPLHEGMEPDPFITGVTLIPAKAKEDEVVGFQDTGAPILAERQNLYFVPYIKVETRVLYFWRYMEKHPEWLGVIEPVGGGEDGLPAGFFNRTVLNAEGRGVMFLCCSMQVRVYDREKIVRCERQGESGLTIVEYDGMPIMLPPAGTKQVNVLGRYGPDENALMKAETGAIGRALGMAGILVLPGSGVATAEDMQDAAYADSRLATGPETATIDARTPQQIEDDLRKRAAELIGELDEHHPDTLAEFRRWAIARKLGTLNSVRNPALNGVVVKLEAMTVAARERAAQDAPADVDLGGEEPPKALTAEEVAARADAGGEAKAE